MGILCVIIIIGPGLLAAVLFEYLKRQNILPAKIIGSVVLFCFFIHLLNLCVLFLRGNESINLSLQSGSMLYSVPFLVKYMGLSCVFALLLPHVLMLYHVVLKKVFHKADGVKEDEK